jgi:predicted lipid-binding transport protein (Tim44 family)
LVQDLFKGTTMKNWLMAAAVVVSATLALAPSISDAKRFGGGSSSGMQRSMPNSSPAKPAAPQQAAPAATPGAAAAPAAAKRNWMGPIAGLAAGLGIAALMSHLGMGEAFGNFIMMALLAMVAFVAIRFLMSRFGGNNATTGTQRGQLAPAGAGADTPNAPAWDKPAAPVMQRSNDAATSGAVLSADGSSRLAPLSATPAAGLPADFDAEGFGRLAKMIFIRMQAANDAGDLNDLRSFTTPEMFAVAKLELQERSGKAQTTDVVKVESEVLDLAKEGERQVVSVRFHGQLREDIGADAENFDEIWHLVRWGDDASWAIAGIQQRH